MVAKLSASDFVMMAKQVHGDKYDYSASVYAGRHSKLIIGCHLHGAFEQTAGSHLNGRGCPTCGQKVKADKRRFTTGQFIEKAKRVHGDKYNYDHVKYVNQKTNVVINCKIHGAFEQSPDMHVHQQQGCPQCGKISASEKQKLTTGSFIEKAKQVHGDKYDYSGVDYLAAIHPVKIICKNHGAFFQRAANHLHGQGCPQCRYTHIADSNRYSRETFIQKANLVHKDKYDYEDAEYVDSQVKVSIRCEKHGHFNQRPYSHLAGTGCPKCAGTGTSKGEQSLFDFVKSLTPDAQQSVRSIIAPQELDIVVPSAKVAIEFNGVWWHSERYRDADYHIDKRLETERAGYRLISVREDLWNEKREQVENIIRNALGLNRQIVYARKCKVVTIDGRSASEFLNQYHVQGSRGASYYYGLTLDDVLVAVMSVTHWVKKNRWELVRYATSKNVTGGLSKLWKYIVKENKIENAFSYVDRDLFTGSSYSHAGFVYDSTSVGFRIVVGETTQSRQKWNRAPEGMTQNEWYEKEGVSRIYDSGQDKIAFLSQV